MKSRRLLMVVYDGVSNSVFESLVLAPAKKKITSGLFSHIDIISFETDYSAACNVVKKFECHGISILIFRRLPIFGMWSLLVQAPMLARRLLSSWYDEICTRGPLAAYVLRYAISWFVLPLQSGWCVPIVIQARGLAADEARFSHREGAAQGMIKKFIFFIKLSTLQSIEAQVYQKSFWPTPVKIFAVSVALQEYLIEHFGTDRQLVFIEDFDLVEPVDGVSVRVWRHEHRGFLKIPQDAVVYGYSGSCKKWQCAQETVEFIAQKINQNQNVYGLILSTDVLAFQKIISQINVDHTRLLVKFVDPNELLQWLSVLDYGVLLRYQDIVNWVSRPTKALEYLAVGLPIIHNNTIKWLVDHDAQLGIGGNEMTPHPRQLSLS